MEIEREYYLDLRRESFEPICQLNILRLYFNYISGVDYDEDNFNYILTGAVDDDPVLKDKINWMYPMIITCFDKKLGINILTKQEVVKAFEQTVTRDTTWFF